MLKHVLPGRRSLARFALVLSMVLVLVIGCLTTSYAASAPKTIKSKVYSEVYKKGNTVYCSDGYSIYKVNTKTNSVKRLLKPKVANCNEFIVHGRYIYFTHGTLGVDSRLCRVRKFDGKYYKKMTKYMEIMGFGIKGSKLYYTYGTYVETADGEEKTIKHTKRMTLLGKKKKTVRTVVKTKFKKTNAKGYKIIEKQSKDFEWMDTQAGYTTTYLRKPNGTKIKLGKYYGKNLSID